MTVTPTTLEVTELGASGTVEKTYTVVLDTDPGADVTITVANGDSTAVEVDTDGSTTGNQNTLTFTHGSGGNWSTQQTVTVRALNDADAAGETVALSHTAAVSDTNNAYHGIDISDVTVTTVDAGHGVIVSESSLSVVENLMAHYTVVLESDPGGTVAVTPSSGAPATASVSGVLTFTSSNWPTAQTVTVTGGAPGSTNISHAVTTSTTDYPTTTTIPSLSVTVTADTRPVVTITGGSAVTEGTAASFTVTVTPAPGADLTVDLDVSESDNFVAAADEGTRSVTVGTSGTATVTVDTTADSTDELNGSVKVAVSDGTGYRVGDPGTATVEVIDNDPTAVTLAGGGTVAEDGSDSADVTVTLGRRLVVGESVTVPLSITGTGVTASDYAIGLKSGSSLNSGVTLNASSPHSAAEPAVVFTGHGTNTVSIATLTISAQQDRDDEGASESLTVGFGSGGRAVSSNLDRVSGTGTAGTTPTGTAGITITDDDTAGVTVSESARTVAEAGGTATYTVVLDSRPSGSVTITAASGNAAVELEGPDADSTYSASEALVFTTANWRVAQTVTVRGVDDNVVNSPARSATVSHSIQSGHGDGGDYTPSAPTIPGVTVTLTDDDTVATPVASFASGTASAGEGAGTHNVTVNLTSAAPSGGLTLAYTLSGTATRGTDYAISGVSSNSATVAVAAGATSATVAVAITDDADDESNETVILTLGSGSGYTVGSTSAHTLTITDDDTAGVTVSESARTVAEAGGTATYTVVLDSRPSGSVTITAASGNAAVELEGPDADSTYSASEALVFTTANWSVAQTVTVRGVDDNVVNLPARSATVSHSIQAGHGDGGDYTPSAPTIPRVTVTLTDDDTTGTQQALVSNLGQSGGAWTTLAGSDNRAQAFTTGSNTGGYTLASVEVAYWSPSAANQNRLTVTLRRANNSGNPGATLGTLGNPTIPNVANRHVLEHAAPGSGIQLEAGTTYFVHFSGGLSGSMGVTAMSSDAEDAGVASGWSIADGSKFGGSSWGDFGNSIQIRVNGTVDQASEPVVSIAGSGTVTEGGDAVFNLSADPAPSGTITVNVTVADSGAFASGGQAGARTVEMSSGSASLTVATAGDSTDEPNGTITATVATGSGYSPSGTNGSATIAVADDDATTVTLSTPDASAEEGSTSDTATVRLTLNRGLMNGETLTVPLRFTGGTIGTHFTLACPSPRPSGVSCANLGTANAAVTFTGPSSGATATTANLTLSVPGNAVTADRTVTADIPRSSSTGSPRLTVGGLGGGATGARTGNGQIELTDDAANRPTITIESGSAVTEGTAAGFTLRVSPAPSAALSVRVRVADAPGSNFVTAENEGVRTVTVAASQTSTGFSVPTATDSTDEANGPVSATVAAHTSYTVGSPSRATVAVADDDATTATLAGPAGSIREGGSKALTLTLNRGLRAGERLTVPLTFAGAATRGTDYGLSGTPATGVSYNNLGSGSATVVFAGPSTGASARTARLTLSATSDGTTESPETVNIGLGPPTFSGLGGGATGADNLANFDIEDPPPVVPTVRFSPATSRAAEDAGPQSITLHLNPVPSTPVTLRYAVGGTATAGSDYAGLSGTIPVSPGDTTATLAVSITDDGDAEPAETVILTLTADAAYTVGTPGAHTLTIDSSDNPPTASDGTVRTRPGRAYAFRVEDFGYQDPDGDPLAHVAIETLPSPGTLTLGDTDVTVDGQIARARIAAGDLKFTPAEQPLKGSPYARFTFKVNDGSADSVSSYTLAIHVANQPPVATDGEARLSSGTPHAFGLEDFRDLHSDADGDPLAGIMIVAPPEKGMLALEDTAVMPNTAVSREKLEAGALVFMPEAGEGGSPYTSFGFQVYDGFEYSADPAQMVLHVESLAATRMMRQWLARFGRTVADQVIGAVEDRLRHPPAPARDASLQLSLAGRSLDSLQPLDEQTLNAHSNPAASDPAAGPPAHSGVREGTDLRTAPLMSGEDVPLSRRETAAPDFLGRLDWIGGSSFHYARGNRDGGLKSVWGRGAVSQFDGRDGSARVDGRVESWMLGADFMQDGRALGILLSHSRGKGDYRTESGGRFASDLTGIYPYARHELHERLSLWGVAGYGEGDVELHRATETLETDVDLWMVAGGLHGQLRAGSGIWPELSAVADGLWLETGSDALGEVLPAVDAEVSRLRVGLEGAWAAVPVGHGQLSPRLRLSLRHDGGDAEDGFGTEVRAGADWRDARHGLKVQVQAHTLLTHEEDGAQEKGISGSVAWDPRPGSLRGAEFSLAASAGHAADRAGLLKPETFGERLEREHAAQWQATLGYGVGAFGDRFTAVPQLDAAWSADAWDLGLGWRLVAEAFDLRLKVGHHSPREDDSENQIRIQLQGRW